MGFGSFFRCGPAFFGTTALPWKGGRIERLSNFSDYTSGLHGSGTARGSVNAPLQSEDLELTISRKGPANRLNQRTESDCCTPPLLEHWSDRDPAR